MNGRDNPIIDEDAGERLDEIDYMKQGTGRECRFTRMGKPVAGSVGARGTGLCGCEWRDHRGGAQPRSGLIGGPGARELLRIVTAI